MTRETLTAEERDSMEMDEVGGKALRLHDEWKHAALTQYNRAREQAAVIERVRAELTDHRQYDGDKVANALDALSPAPAQGQTVRRRGAGFVTEKLLKLDRTWLGWSPIGKVALAIIDEHAAMIERVRTQMRICKTSGFVSLQTLEWCLTAISPDPSYEAQAQAAEPEPRIAHYVARSLAAEARVAELEAQVSKLTDKNQRLFEAAEGWELKYRKEEVVRASVQKSHTEAEHELRALQTRVDEAVKCLTQKPVPWVERALEWLNRPQ